MPEVDSEDDLPSLDTFFAQKKLRQQENKTTTTTKTVNSTPNSIERHKLLAASLFPTPSPPSHRSRSVSPSPSVISDSEPDLPSSLKASTTRNGLTASSLGISGSSKSVARHSSVESLLVNDSEGEEELSLGTRSVFNLSEEEGVGGDFGFQELTINERYIPKQNSTPSRTPRAKAPKTPKRRIVISIDSSDSDSDCPRASTSTLPSRMNSARKAKSNATSGIYAAAVECICLDDSDEDQVESTPIAKRLAPFDDLGPDDGVLVYEPTPRARKPVKLDGTPIRSAARVKPSATTPRNIIEIDLTSESDGDDNFTLPLPKSMKPPIPSTPSRSTTKAKPLFKPSLVLPSTPSSSSTSTPKAKTSILTALERESLPLALIRELDKSVFRKEWNGLKIVGEGGKGLPDGMELKWSKRLLNTAGRATVKTTTTGGKEVHQTLIDLSVKVTDTEEKLRHTLAHECCHVASWVISKEMKPSHGPAFKLWAKRVMQVRKDIKITTTHSYEIAYKFRWQCVSPTCQNIFQRHSASVNIESHGCSCGSKLVAIDKDGNVKVPRKVSQWQEFLTAMGPRTRLENPGLNQGEITKIIAGLWKEAKELAVTLEGSNKNDGTGLVKAMQTLVVEDD